MDVIEESPVKMKWNLALQRMQSALDTLDESAAPAEIGSHLDLAICRLEDALGCNPADNTIQQLQAEIENALAMSKDVTKSDTSLWLSHSETLPPSDGDRSLLFR